MALGFYTTYLMPGSMTSAIVFRLGRTFDSATHYPY